MYVQDFVNPLPPIRGEQAVKRLMLSGRRQVGFIRLLVAFRIVAEQYAVPY